MGNRWTLVAVVLMSLVACDGPEAPANGTPARPASPTPTESWGTPRENPQLDPREVVTGLPFDGPRHELLIRLRERIGTDSEALAARLGEQLLDPTLAEEDRDRFLAVLGLLGADAAAAREGLLALVEGGEGGAEEATLILAALGEGAASTVPRLLSVLESGHSPVVAEAIARTGSAGIESLLELAARGAPDDALRGPIDAGLLAADPEDLVPVVSARLLGDDAVELKVRLLNVLGESAHPMSGDVVAQFLGDDADDLHDAALYALIELGPMAQGARYALVRVLERATPDESVGTVLEALVATAGDGSVAASALARILDHDEQRATGAARALQRLGRRAVAAGPALLRALDGPASVRIPVLNALMQVGDAVIVGEPGRVAVERIADDMTDGAAPQLRMAALRAAAGVGPQATALLPRVRDIAGSAPSAHERLLAAFALFRISGDPAPLEEEIVRSLDSRDADVRDAACQLAGRMGLRGSTLVPVLAPLLTRGRQKDEWAWPAILEAFEHLGPVASVGRDAVRTFIDAHAGSALEDRGVRTLVAIGIPVEEAVRRWTRLLTSAYAASRAAGCTGLAELGSGARAAVPQLELALVDRDWRVRRAAAAALARIR